MHHELFNVLNLFSIAWRMFTLFICLLERSLPPTVYGRHGDSSSSWQDRPREREKVWNWQVTSRKCFFFFYLDVDRCKSVGAGLRDCDGPSIGQALGPRAVDHEG